jgi:NAD(P)-dependent dehydrogenase (short-subunit alcohol dehydrogenase family)
MTSRSPNVKSAKVALVTGAGSGIGKAVALGLLREGYAVVLAGRRAETLEHVRAEAGSHGERALPAPTDVRDPEAVRALFARIVSTFGRLDFLFNNAGINAPGIPLEISTTRAGARFWTRASPERSSAPRKPSRS